jgi:hypothetical protein
VIGQTKESNTIRTFHKGQVGKSKKLSPLRTYVPHIQLFIIFNK